MVALFLDSSALVKRYVRETGTDWILQRTEPAVENSLFVARLTGVEVVAALSRKMRERDAAIATISTAIANFRRDFPLAFSVVEITPALIASAMRSAERHALRAYDAMQLAAALVAKFTRAASEHAEFVFISSDTNLNSVAIAEGLAVEDPMIRHS